MTGEEVFDVLSQRGGGRLYHANSVKTSVSLLKLGALASRGAVEERHLSQTSQISDKQDREYGIWYDAFVDSFDIHRSLRRRNHYGPVLFVMSAELLLRLPAGAQVQVTRCNPTKWKGLAEDQRYFINKTELAQGMRVGHFDHMVTIRAPNGVVPFADTLQKIVLDEPRLFAPGVGSEYVGARDALQAAAGSAGIGVPIERRICFECQCTAEYQDSEKPNRIRFFFGT